MPNDGPKQMVFRVTNGSERACTFQCSDVNKMLACVAGLCDGPSKGAENLVIFSSRGGCIVPESEVKVTMPTNAKNVTEFSRRGMVYQMDAWVRKEDVVRKEATAKSASDFRRPGK